MLDGLEYGLNFPVFKSSVTSRELKIFFVCYNGNFQIVVRKKLVYLFLCFLYLPSCLIENREPVVSVEADFNTGDLLQLC